MRMILWLMLAVPLFGFTYNQLQINAQASIFPKLLLLDKHPDTLLVDGKILFVIAYEPEDVLTASRLKAQMEQLYPGHIEGYPFEVKTVTFDRIDTSLNASALYVLHSEKSLQTASNVARDKGIVSFVYDIADLDKGYLFALTLERRTVIYLNRAMLPRYGITFADPLYQIVRFVDEGS